MARGDLAAKQPHPAGADDRQADALRILLRHQAAARMPFVLFSGSETGSLRAAERSAAMYTSITLRACSGLTITSRSWTTASRKCTVSGAMGPAEGGSTNSPGLVDIGSCIPLAPRFTTTASS